MRHADDWTIERWKTEPRMVGLELGEVTTTVEPTPPLWKDLMLASALGALLLAAVVAIS